MSRQRLSENPWFLFFTIAAVLSLGALAFDVVGPIQQRDRDGGQPVQASAAPPPQPDHPQTFSAQDEAAYEIARAWYDKGERDKAMPILLELAGKGLPSAQYKLGLTCDGDRRVTWLQKAALQGHRDAQWELGMSFLMGSEGNMADLGEAEKWLSMAAENGHGAAANLLGMIFGTDEEVKITPSHGGAYVVPPDPKKGFKWYSKAVELRDSRAYAGLGYLYEKGLGTAKNETKAATLYETGANMGEEKAQYRLGLMYLEGRGVVQNRAEAVKWIRKAAESGSDAAVEKLKTLQ